MVKLKYKSLVTKEIIDYYLSRIKDERKTWKSNSFGSNDGFWNYWDSST